MDTNKIMVALMLILIIIFAYGTVITVSYVGLYNETHSPEKNIEQQLTQSKLEHPTIAHSEHCVLVYSETDAAFFFYCPRSRITYTDTYFNIKPITLSTIIDDAPAYNGMPVDINWVETAYADEIVVDRFEIFYGLKE